jgi:hypothetical protein
VCKFECVSELFSFPKEIFINMKKLTSTVLLGPKQWGATAIEVLRKNSGHNF